jgi:hypothetical protein
LRAATAADTQYSTPFLCFSFVLFSHSKLASHLPVVT